MMAANSADEPSSQPQQVLVDTKWAKKAIAKVASVLRELLKNPERVNLFIQSGLLEPDSTDVVKGLQSKIDALPSLFEVLLNELRNFSSERADSVVKKLRGNY